MVCATMAAPMRPAPTVAVFAVASYTTPLNLDMEICTPVVLEKPGFDACPPPLTCGPWGDRKGVCQLWLGIQG